MNTLYLLAIASVFQSMEQPAYDALIADLTPYTDRERAYSLNYLAYNLGLVMAPTIGGLLFNNHLNLSFLINGLADLPYTDRERAYSLNYLAYNLGLVMAPTIGGLLFNNHLNLSFLINGLADLSSTLLILFFIHNLKAVRQEGRPENVYEQGQSSSIFQVLRQRKLFFLLFLIMGLSSLIYSQFNFLMPLHMEQAFRGSGALKFGMLTSVNAITVVVGTPILTKLLSRMIDLRVMYLGQLQAFRGSGALKFGMLTSVNAITVVVGTPILTKLLSRMIDLRVMYLGQFLESAGLACFIVLGRHFWIAIVGMVVFTTGEICLSISQTLRVMYLGQFLESAGLACFIVLGRHFWIAIVGMVVFTTGEICLSISQTPYITKRIPETHRGRFLSISSSCVGLIGVCSNYGVFTTGEICLSISQTPYITKRIPETHRGRFLSISSSCVGLIGVCSNYGVGILIDHYPIPAVWSIIAAIGVAVLVLYAIYLLLDRKTYSKLYEKQ